MKEHSIYFKGIGTYDLNDGKVTYNIIMPKIDGVNFKFYTDQVERTSYQGKECLMIYTDNGVDDDNYGYTPEIIQISFTIKDVKSFDGKEIIILINHDANRSRPSGRKPGSVGLGIVRP